ncbi:hypothetical protein BC937DRAFT_91490 [Endogone sp. FLAS-F59071]|nr:hypothetical protein BC937DRAFT_91490 [Endogone sp. FLAS-F59071]|eukprot:RUS16213.1 hypothetical protein BC937DRAFT_91490 [Endogone sp. FLAS-F59071]
MFVCKGLAASFRLAFEGTSILMAGTDILGLKSGLLDWDEITAILEVEQVHAYIPTIRRQDNLLGYATSHTTTEWHLQLNNKRPITKDPDTHTRKSFDTLFIETRKRLLLHMGLGVPRQPVFRLELFPAQHAHDRMRLAQVLLELRPSYKLGSAARMTASIAGFSW